MPPLDFWIFLVLLLVLTIAFCCWLYIRNYNGFDKYFEADVFITIGYVPEMQVLNYVVKVVRQVPLLDSNKFLQENITGIVFKIPDRYNLWFEDLEPAMKRAIDLAEKYNLEFRYHES